MRPSEKYPEIELPWHVPPDLELSEYGTPAARRTGRILTLYAPWGENAAW